MFSNGYGRISDQAMCGKGKQALAHRVSYILFNGDPGHSVVRHKCDNPKCVNPEHLELGTQQDNLNDAWARRRLKVGEANTSSKITDEQAWEILVSDESGASLAKKYHLSQGQISRIRTGQRRNWDEPKNKIPQRSRSKLTETDVQEIVRLKGIETCASIAARYGVTNQQVSRIQNGRRSGSSKK